MVTVAANASGGVVGKMISPQSIAVAAAGGHLVGKESDLFRFTVKHSFIMLLFICLIVLAQAYLFPSIIPNYQMSDGTAVAHKSTTQDGKIYLLSLMGILILIAWLISRMRLGDTADAEPIRTTLAE